MAANNSQLKWLLRKYISSYGKNRKTVREVLQTTSVEVRYNTFKPEWGRGYTYTAVHMGVAHNDLNSLKCMMSGFTSEQRYNTLKIRIGKSETALHRAAVHGYTNTIMFLLSKLSLEQRFSILKIQSSDGYTALHAAAKRKHTSALQAMLSSVSRAQRMELMNIRDKNGERIVGNTLLLYTVPAWTKMELNTATERLAEIEKQHTATINQLKADLVKQREDNAKQAEQQTEEQRCMSQKLNAVLSEFHQLKLDLVNQTELSDQQVKAVRQDLSAANQKLTVLGNDCNQQKNINEQLRNGLAIQEKENSEHVQRLRVELNAAKDKLTTVSSQQEAIIGSVQRAGTELREVKDRIAAMAADMEKEREEREKLTEKCELAEANNRTGGMQADIDRQREDNIKLTQKYDQLAHELSIAKEQMAALMTNNIVQRNEAARQIQDLATANQKLEALGRQCTQLVADLANLREESAELREQHGLDLLHHSQELRSLADRQERMENMMEEMERLLGQPICIGPEMDQEYEGH